MFNASEILISIVITTNSRRKKAYLVSHLPLCPPSSLTPFEPICHSPFFIKTESWLSPPGNGSLFLPLPKASGRASPNPTRPLAQPSLPRALLEPQSKSRCLVSGQPHGWDGRGGDGRRSSPSGAPREEAPRQLPPHTLPSSSGFSLYDGLLKSSYC